MIRTLLVCCVLALAGLLFLPAALSAAPATSSPMNDAAASPQDAAAKLDILEASEDRIVAALPNRMVIVAQRLPVAPVVSAQIWVKTGSIYEQEHVGAGLSHFLEHLLSGGSTTTRTEAESNAILARIGGQVNAATSLDTVRYFINAPSEHAESAIDLLSDWVRNNRITREEFEREKQVIRSEFAMGRGDPGRVFWKLTQQARYAELPGHPARHPTIGYYEEFETITREKIIDFYRRMYVPNNMVFVVSGDVDPQAMVNAVAERWHDAEPGNLPNVSFPVASDPESRKPDSGNRTLTAHADIRQPRVRLAFPGTRLAGEHDYALDLLAIILGQGESSRLIADLRDERGKVTSISAFNLSFNWGEGFFGIDFQPADLAWQAAKRMSPEELRQIRIARVRAAVLEHLDRLREEPVTDAELARAKRKTMSRIVQSGQSAYDLAARIGRDTTGMHDPDYLLEYENAIRSLTAEDLRAAAEAILDEDELIQVTLLPLEEGEEPTPLKRPEIEQAGDVAEREVALDNAALLADLRKNVGDETGREPIVVGEPAMFTLDNGLRLIVQRSTAVPAASVRVFWKGGLLGDEPGREGVANAAAEMLTRGTQNYTAAELASRIDSLGASLTAAAGNNTTYISATALTSDVPTMVDLVAEVMLRPTFPASEWQRMQPRLLAAIDRQRDSWFGELNHAFRQAYYGEHPWSVTPLGRLEVVSELTAEAIAEHHASHLGAKQTVISIVGDV
ncbi:MAG: M16 family metallopeptidase, partial [Phycisphaeraceae bacterium]